MHVMTINLWKSIDEASANLFEVSPLRINGKIDDVDARPGVVDIPPTSGPIDDSTPGEVFVLTGAGGFLDHKSGCEACVLAEAI